MSEPVDDPPTDPTSGARVGGPQRQARAVATRSAILAAAAEEFAGASYHEASLSRILERSKVTKGALYFHFVSKESIACAVVDEMEVLCREIVVRARAKGLDPLRTAAQVAREVQDALAAPVLRAGHRLCSEGFAGPKRPGWPYAFWQEVFGSLFADAQRAGLLAPGVDHIPLARAVVDISAGAFVASLGVSGLRDLPLRVCQNWELLLGATADASWLADWRADGGMGAVLGPHLTGGWVVEA
jgi:AcrR family transcriptional regulator